MTLSRMKRLIPKKRFPNFIFLVLGRNAVQNTDSCMLTLKLNRMLIKLIRLIFKEKGNGSNDTDAGSHGRINVSC